MIGPVSADGAPTQQQAEAWPRADTAAWEYKVITETALAGWGDGTILGLEGLLNALAADGWRVVSATMTGKVEQAFAMDTNGVCVVLERPARPAASASTEAAPNV
jgi:hypothetical protein